MDDRECEMISVPIDEETLDHHERSETLTTTPPPVPQVRRQRHCQQQRQQEDHPETFSKSWWKITCCPHPSVTYKGCLPLLIAFVALALTGEASWDCAFFHGASIGFTGNQYGLWTLLDSTHKCQLWDVLFFSYKLDAPLKAARFFSMAAQLLGLALIVVLTQALQFHAVGWGFGIALLILFLASVWMTSVFNVWTMFVLCSYVILVLIVRFLFIHPVHRRISKRGTKIIAYHCFLNGVYCFLTLFVLKSDFCTCDGITAARLEGREPGDACSGTCRLGRAGGFMIGAALLWWLSCAAVLKCGVQPEELHQKSNYDMHAHYPVQSITARLMRLGSRARTNMPVRRPQQQQQQQHPDGEEDDDAAIKALEDESLSDDIEDDHPLEIECDNEHRDDRTCCQKLCFDYRVTERSRCQKIRFWLFRTCIVVMMVIYLFICVVKLASFMEDTNAAKAPDTSYNFITDVVCGYDPLDTSRPFREFATKEEALLANYSVAHCGSCGVCSNPYDIRRYVETRETVADSAKKCGPAAIFRSYDELVECLEDRIGFSQPCTECWADNMKTTAKYCIFTCMVTLLNGLAADNNIRGAGDEGWLNQCLFCDEKRSGPAFVECSGVARRRLGIRSEIVRNPNEQCRNVDLNWLEVDFDNAFPGSDTQS